MGDVKLNFKKPEINDNLVFYYHPFHFHSQKVLVVLHEKKIVFTPYMIDMANGEQFSNWFLNLNPAGDVPVLQDGCFVIPNSNQIINYLEHKFKGDSVKKLIPADEKESQKVIQYHTIICRLPIGALSLGSFIHDDLKLNPKSPFIGPVRKTVFQTNERVHNILKGSIDANKEHFSTLTKKIELQERRYDLIKCRVEFQKLLDAATKLLQSIDEELKLNEAKKQKWICTNEITLADITLGLLLNRLYTLGFENLFWTNGKMPYLEKYWNEFKNRESFKEIVPTSIENLKAIWEKTPSSYKVGAGVLGMAIFAASALVHRI